MYTTVIARGTSEARHIAPGISFDIQYCLSSLSMGYLFGRKEPVVECVAALFLYTYLPYSSIAVRKDQDKLVFNGTSAKVLDRYNIGTRRWNLQTLFTSRLVTNGMQWSKLQVCLYVCSPRQNCIWGTNAPDKKLRCSLLVNLCWPTAMLCFLHTFEDII